MPWNHLPVPKIACVLTETSRNLALQIATQDWFVVVQQITLHFLSQRRFHFAVPKILFTQP